jgi:hypothetical protein
MGGTPLGDTPLGGTPQKSGIARLFCLENHPFIRIFMLHHRTQDPP